MIVKLHRLKKPDFSKLIPYIARDKGRSKDNTHAIFHNISVSTLNGAIKDFKENDSYRKQRNDGVSIYHEIISFHEADSEKLTLEILNDIARKYIQIRGENALCFAKAHIEDKHKHIHFAFSGTELFSSKTLRLDNKDFRRVKKQIEAYQLKKYPELTNSIVYHNEKKKAKNRSDREYQLKKRTNRETDKEIIQKLLEKAFRKSNSFEIFLETLTKRGFEVYKYRERVNGIIYNDRKYKFVSLGFGPERFEEKEYNLRILENYRRVLKEKKAERDLLKVSNSEIFHSRDRIKDIVSNREPTIILKKIELRNLQRIYHEKILRR